MKKSLKSEYGRDIIDSEIEYHTTSGDFSLSDAEHSSSEIAQQLNKLGLPVSVPDHRVKPLEEGEGNAAEYERRAGEKGIITFYSSDETSVGSLTKDGEQISYHEFGHHLGYEIKSWLHHNIDYENSDIENTDGGMEWASVTSYLQSENFADRFRVAATGDHHLDLRSGSADQYSGMEGGKYSVGKDSWDTNLPQFVDNLEDEIERMVDNLTEKGWAIDEPVI